jgi:two-component sensor histidine kinase
MSSIFGERQREGELDAVTSALERSFSWWRSSWRLGLRPRSAASLIFALVCVAIATLVRFALGVISPDSAVFAPYYSATLVAALVGGGSAGVLATASGGIVAIWLFVPPDWNIAPFRLEQIVSLLLFATSSVVIIWAADSYRNLLQRLREEEATRTLLNHEMNHRIKNILANVQAILYQTLHDQKDIRDKTIARITSFVATNDALVRADWSGASFREILRNEFAPYDLSRFHLTGEDVICPPEIAVLLALIVHELTTNAVKHGALSNAAGRVYLTWSKRKSTLCLKWAEYGGPKPSDFARQGFGTKLLLTSVRQLNGTVAYESRPTGLFIEFSMDLPTLSRKIG